jgi:hypothetical protein
VYWYKHVNHTTVKFLTDDQVLDAQALFSSPNIESWGHKRDSDGTVDLVFPEIWDVLDQEDLDAE